MQIKDNDSVGGKAKSANNMLLKFNEEIELQK